jgi:hypothetical protein
MDGFRFDRLTRLVGARLSRRTGLALLTAGAIGQSLSPSAAGKKKKPQKISICYQGRTRKVKKKGWKKRYEGATKEPNCGSGCCPENSCFAETVNPADSEPMSFACCPPELLCPSPKAPFPDQCCYPDETCKPALADDPLAQTICCRPCAGVPGGCCLNQNEECVGGACVPADTARLPRRRRL